MTVCTCIAVGICTIMSASLGPCISDCSYNFIMSRLNSANEPKLGFRCQGPDLQNILRQSYDYLTIMPKLRSTYDGRLIYQTSYEERKAFLPKVKLTNYLQNRKIV